MNRNPLLGQVLGGLIGQAMSRRGMGTSGGMGGGLGGLGGIAMGSVLGGMLGGRRGPMGLPAARGGNARAALLLMLLPMAMRWVQSNGGVGAVLDRFRQKGYAGQTRSWVDRGENQPLDEQAVEQVVGHAELRQMAQRLGVPEQEVAQAFAEIMPEMVDQLTPAGELPQQADEVLADAGQALEREIQDVDFRELRKS
ncbi:MAG TPA: YidB family protein [Ramlibacter sp.]|nr:YidB family protein [Ramlibacter sp.]